MSYSSLCSAKSKISSQLSNRWFWIKEYRRNYFIWWTKGISENCTAKRHAEFCFVQMEAIWDKLSALDQKFLQSLNDPPFPGSIISGSFNSLYVEAK